MNIRRFSSSLMVAACALAFGGAAAAASSDHLPALQKQGAISYLSGGIGQTEAKAMQRAAAKYPLELEFVKHAHTKNEYLADVKVKVRDDHHKLILDTTANGPFLLAKLPPGKYTVDAVRNGKSQQRSVEIAAHAHRQVVFEWMS